MFSPAFAGVTPPIASELGSHWDPLYQFLIGISLFFFLLIMGLMFYFIFKYTHRKNQETRYILNHPLLEVIWIVIPLGLLMGVFVWGYFVYNDMKTVPPNAYEIHVIGKQWSWTFQYDDGRTTVGEVYVPVNQPTKFVMTSEDVLHGLFIPHFRIKQDVVPGIYSQLWFTPTVPGRHKIFCTEYCGTEHSSMIADVIVLETDDWNRWLQHQTIAVPPKTAADVNLGTAMATVTQQNPPIPQVTLARRGEELSVKKGCIACHSQDGSEQIGPSFLGMFGSQVELANGSSQVVNESFIRAHILNPTEHLIKGYRPVMPTFQGLLTEEEINALVAWIKSLKQP